jgi:ANTAR domain
MAGFDPATGEIDELRSRVDQLEEERDQLAHALESRIVIEQAKGILAERYHVTVEDAFLLLRRSARSARVRIHDLAADVVRQPQTPAAVTRGLARDTRLRTAAIRERSEATAEAHARLVTRLTAQTAVDRPTARVRVTSRADAVELAARLAGYRWYLIVPDEQHWEVVVEYSGSASELPRDLRERICDWLAARSLASARIRLGDLEVAVDASGQRLGT